MNEDRTCTGADTGLTRPDSPNVHGSTYFVRAGEAIKIGSATNFKSRLHGLQTGQAEQLEVLAVVPAYLVDEFKAHQLFAHLRIRGEWFRAEPELLYFIEQAKTEAADRPEPEAELQAPRSARSVPLSNVVSEHDAMRRKLIAVRVSVGAKTRRGYAASNPAEQLKHYQTATGAQRENLARAIPYQMARLSNSAA